MAIETETVTEVNMSDAELLQAAIDQYTTESKTKTNGIIDIPKGSFSTGMLERHGITREQQEQYHKAVDFETTAAAGVARAAVEARLAEATPDQLSDDEFRRGVKATVRLPTYGGATEVTFRAETSNPIPFRGDGEPQRKTSYGTLSTTINSKGRIHKEFLDESIERMRRSLNVTDGAD